MGCGGAAPGPPDRGARGSSARGAHVVSGQARAGVEGAVAALSRVARAAPHPPRAEGRERLAVVASRTPVATGRTAVATRRTPVDPLAALVPRQSLAVPSHATAKRDPAPPVVDRSRPVTRQGLVVPGELAPVTNAGTFADNRRRAMRNQERTVKTRARAVKSDEELSDRCVPRPVSCGPSMDLRAPRVVLVRVGARSFSVP